MKSEDRSRIFLSAIRYPLYAILLSGCSMKSIALKTTAEIIRNGMPAVYEESDLRFAEEALPSQLKQIEVFLKNDPENRDLVLTAAQGFGAYAYLFIEERDPERAKDFYMRGLSRALYFISQRYRIDLPVENDLSRFESSLDKIKDLPILFWAAYCWGGLCNLSLNEPDQLANLPKVEKIMLAVRREQKDFFYAGASLFLGSYYGSRPKMFGGDLKKSKAYFDEAVELTHGNFLTAFVLYAKHYAVPAQDKELYKALLERVAQFPANSFPEQRLSNEIAKKQAKKMLEEIDEKF